MTSELERRYRALLRMLPADYRAAWEDEMVATFLESTARDDPEEAEFAADFGRPSWPEVASVLALAVRLRLGGTGAGPRRRACGDAVRLVALMGLLAQAVLAVLGLGTLLWLAGKLPGTPPPPQPDLQPGRWEALRVLLECAAVPAYVALPVGAGLSAVLVVFDVLDIWPLIDLAALYCLALVGAALVHLVAGPTSVPGRWRSLWRRWSCSACGW